MTPRGKFHLVLIVAGCEGDLDPDMMRPLVSDLCQKVTWEGPPPLSFEDAPSRELLFSIPLGDTSRPPPPTCAVKNV